ncbi:MAG: hypothetical protein WC768_00080 [Patescibacteria group bacterium]|jgi:hypothetical protein
MRIFLVVVLAALSWMFYPIASVAVAVLAVALFWQSRWKWVLLVVIPLAVLLANTFVPGKIFWGVKVKPVVASINVKDFQVQLPGPNNINPNAAAMTKQLIDIEQIAAASNRLAEGFASVTDWTERIIVRSPAPLMQVKEGGWAPMDDQVLDQSRPVKACYRLAFKTGGMAESLVPVQQLKTDGASWILGYVWHGCLGPIPSQKEVKVELAVAVKPLLSLSKAARPKEGMVLATMAGSDPQGWTPTNVVVCKDEIFEFGPLNSENDVKRLRVRSGDGLFGPLNPVQLADNQWCARVHFSTGSLLGEVLRFKLLTGSPLEVKIRRIREGGES